MSDFEGIEVWERAALLNAKMNCSLRSLRDPVFRDQLARAGTAMLNNIAEGLSQDSQIEKNRFLNIACLSCGQLQGCVHLGGEMGYIDANQVGAWFAQIDEIAAILARLSPVSDG